MLAPARTTLHDQPYRAVGPLAMSAAPNKGQFITQFITLHYQDTQPILVHQLLSIGLPHTTAEFWIIYDDHSQPVACAGANTAIANPSIGYVGLFEAKTEQAGIQVLKLATEWLRKGGVNQFEPVQQVLGPINMTTWLQYRLRVDTIPEAPMSFEPRHPKFYQDCFAKADFVKAVDFYSTFFDIDAVIERGPLFADGHTFENTGVRVEPWSTLDFAGSLDPERHPELTPRDNVAKRLYDLSLELFHGKDFFDDAFTRENHRNLVLNDMISRPEVDHASFMDLSTFMVDEATGKDLGYLACWVENGDTVVMKTIGFVPSFRKSRAFSIVVPETCRRAKEVWGCTRCVLALMNEYVSNLAEMIVGESVRHVYRLYAHNPGSKVASQVQQDDRCEALSQEGQQAPSIKKVTIAATSASVANALDISSVPSINDQTKDQLQRHQRELRLRTYWDQQRSNRLARRSGGRILASL